jgi:hypothetical protein
MLARKADLVRDASSAAARALRLLLGGTDLAGVVAEHGQRADHVAELVRPRGREGGVEVAARDREHARRDAFQAADDEAGHEQPDDQPGDEEARCGERDEPGAGGVNLARGQLGGEGRVRFRRLDESVHLSPELGRDGLERRLALARRRVGPQLPGA